MRILIDTNILIDLEDHSEIAAEFAQFSQLAISNGCQILVHPTSILDMQRDQEVQRQKIMLSKFKKYPTLDSPPEPDLDFLKLLVYPGSSDNDRVDNRLLFALFKNCIDILVTEDRKIHTKAERIGIADKVYFITDICLFLEARYVKRKVELPNIEEEYLYNLDFGDEIFASIRQEYQPFDVWLQRIAAQGRKAWICRDENQRLASIVIYKDETNHCDFFLGKILKICTFKVLDKFRGRKIGELNIKMIFNYCLENRYEKAYVTVFSQHQQLINLVEEFGFIRTGQKAKDGDDVYAKDFNRPSQKNVLDAVEFHKINYPYFLVKGVNKYIVPIAPQYHRELFSDFVPVQREFLLQEHLSHSNAIKKAYLCHAKLRCLAAGDLLVFYRSRDLKKLTSLGIVEHIMVSNEVDEILSLVGKRTVFSQEEITSFCSKPLLVILFRQIKHLTVGLSFNELKKRGIIKNHIESITKIDDTNFCKIIEESNDNILAY